MKECIECNRTLNEDCFEKNRNICKKCRWKKRKTTHKLVCEICGNHFTNARKEVRFCSRQCQDENRRDKITVQCYNCGRDTTIVKSRLKYSKHIHCSEKCKAETQKTSTLSDKEREELRQTPEYYQWRREVFERDNFKCQCCGIHNRKLNAHHIFNFSSHIDIRTNINNGITLCQQCHKEFHGLFGIKNNNKNQLETFFKLKQANTEVIPILKT